jgi:hypothetical protein
MKDINEISSFENWNIFDVGFLAGWHKEDREYLYNRFLRWTHYHTHEIKKITKQINRISQQIHFSYNVKPSLKRYYDNLLEQLNFHSYYRHKTIEEYDYFVNRAFLDQTAYDYKTKRGFDPYHVARKIDLMTRDGMDRHNHIVVNESRSYFTIAGIGMGLNEAKLSDQGLENEIIRIPISTTGSISALGDSIRVFVIFPNGIKSGLYSEHAVYDSLIGGVCWYRVKYPNNRLLKHEQGDTFPTTSHFIYTKPV